MEVANIYKQFHSELLGYVKSKVRLQEDAEDIVQNVFIKISMNVDKLTEEVKLKNWLFTITRNAVIDYYRVNATRKKLAVNEEINEDISEPEDIDPTKGLDQCITSMIKLLPDEYREIIIESEIRGIRQKELAEKYAIAYPSMRSRVQRGREKLKELFYNCCHIETNKMGSVLSVAGRNNCSGPCTPGNEIE